MSSINKEDIKQFPRNSVGSFSSSDNSKDVSKVEAYHEETKEVHAPNFNDDPNNPMNWLEKKKMLCLVGVSLNSFIGYFASAIYMPAVSDIMLYFNTNLTVINATVALYLIVNAIAPLFWAPLSERIGRRNIYIVSLLLFAVCSVICGISTNIGLFFAFRLLQAVFGGAAQSVGGGTISDLFDFKDRGKAMGIFMLGTILGPAIAPVIGGYINQYLGWRWIFYIKAIIGALFAFISFLIVPETLYKPEENEKPVPSTISEKLERLKFNPFVSFNLLVRPENALACLQVSIGFGWFYYLVTTMSITFTDIYHFSSGSAGLCFLSSGIGNIICTVFYGATCDKFNNYLIRRNNGIRVPEFRLMFNYIALPFIITGFLLYGWLLHAQVHYIAPLVGVVLFNFGMTITIASTNNYMAEADNKRAASAIAVNNFTRSLSGMIFALTAVSIRSSLGDGWAYTLAAIMSLIGFLGCNHIVMKHGPSWRARRIQCTGNQ